MDFVEIEKQLRIQLCTNLNRTCDDILNKLIQGLMYNIRLYNSTMEHVRYGTMEVKNEYYYQIDFEINSHVLDIKLYYTKNNAYRSYHKVHIKL